MTRATDTRGRILAAATGLLRGGGLPAVTFDAVAATLGVTKQAVIYWFPTKSDLLAEIALPGLQAEAAAAIAAARAAPAGKAAAAAVVRALIAFHLENLERFRLLYVAPQSPLSNARAFDFVDRVHPISRAMYDAIEAALGEVALGEVADARRTAVALHMASLGHVLLVALTDAVGDPLAQPPAQLAERLAQLVADGVGG
jgi:AcrR family transcriptional regulator